MAVTIRQLNETDWREYSQTRLRALQTDPQVFVSTFQKEARFAEIDWRNRLKNNNIFLIYDDSEAIGMTGVSIYLDDTTGKTAIFWGSWFAPEFRGRKLSNLMYQTRLDWARKQPLVERILVSHRASNIAAKRASGKHGFTFSHTDKLVWSDGISEDLLSYELKIER